MVVIFSAIALDKLPLNMVGITILLVALGHPVFHWGKTPDHEFLSWRRVSFYPAWCHPLASFHLVPTKVMTRSVTSWGRFGFLDFYIAALICGSILGMNRNLLVKASTKFIPVALITMVVGFFSVGLVGMLLGNGFADSVMYVSLPMMSGGMGAGITRFHKFMPMAANGNQAAIFSQLAPAVTFGNILAIIGALFIAKAFAKTKYNGHGTQ